jgi:PAS domain S-box-containing protein
MTHLGTVLLIEDDPVATLLVRRLLGAASPKPNVVHEGTLASGLAHLDQGGIDLVLVDLGLPDSQGLDTLIAVLHQAPEVPTVVLTGSEDDEHVFEAVRQGAQDYLVKGRFDGKTLIRSLRYAQDRHRMELALKREQELAEIIFQTVNMPVMVLDPQGHILRFNHAWEQTTGYTGEDLWEQCFWELLYPQEEQEAIKKLYEDVRLQPRAGEFEHCWLTKGGQPRIIKWTSAALRDRQGQVLYVVVASTGIGTGGKLPEVKDPADPGGGAGKR